MVSQSTKAMIDQYCLQKIATAYNNRNEIKDDHWGQMITTIQLEKNIPTESLQGIENFSHLDIIYTFHLAKNTNWAAHPRDNIHLPLTGIFAQRKKDRINKIGLCTVELLKATGRTLFVKKFDGINGTPILDIKPVMKQLEPDGPIQQPDWVNEIMKDYWLSI